MNNNLELLLNSTIVSNNLTQELLDTKQDLLVRLDGAKHEVIDYIKELMKNEDFTFEVSMPDKGCWVLHISSLYDRLPTYRFSFGTCSENLWLKLMADNENPVFKLLRFLEDNVNKLDNILKERGIELNQRVLHEFNVLAKFDAEVLVFFASTFWRKVQNIFGECCISKLEKVAKFWLAVVKPAETLQTLFNCYSVRCKNGKSGSDSSCACSLKWRNSSFRFL